MRLPVLLAAILAFSACAEDGFDQLPDPAAQPQGDVIDNQGGADGSGPVSPGDDPIDLPKNEQPSTCQTGAVMGRLCVPGTDNAMSGVELVTIAVDCNGEEEVYKTTSAANGQFSFAGLPVGDLTFQINDPTLGFMFEATVVAGEITVAEPYDNSDPVCAAPGETRVAVIDGDYDEVHLILDSLDIGYERFSQYGGSGADSYDWESSAAREFLQDVGRMTEFDVIMFNCGMMEGILEFDEIETGKVLTDTLIFDNIRHFVQHGGKLYVSDWAYGIAEGIQGNSIDFWGNETQNLNDALVGNDGTVSASLVDPGLRNFMGTETGTIEYDLGAWAVVDIVSPSSQLFVTGDVSLTNRETYETTNLYDKPLMVGFQPFPGGGYVLYTTFHYHNQPNQEMLSILEYAIFQL